AGLALTGVRLIIPDHTVGLPVLRALSLCTCRRQYPGAAAGRNPRSSHPAVAAFPDSAVGSACTSTFSRLARRSLALRPAHSAGHQVVTAIRRLQPFRYPHDCSACFRLERVAAWALHPLESAAFSRRTPKPAVGCIDEAWRLKSQILAQAQVHADSGTAHAIERCETSRQDVGQILPVRRRLPVFAQRDERH